MGLSAYVVVIIVLTTAGCIGNDVVAGNSGTESVVTITDSFGRSVTIPENISRIVCSGSSSLRYVVYLDAEDLLTAASGADQTNSTSTHDTRPYTIANPQFADLPNIGSSDSNINLEQIMVVNPQVIVMVGSLAEDDASGTAAKADSMQTRTGIPVVAVASGSILTEEGREEMYSSFLLMGDVLDRKSQAEELIAYIQATLADLEERTGDIPESEQKTAYVGGVSYSGPHGITSTRPLYPPFEWTHVKNVAGGYDLQYVECSKESLLYADPEYIFIDAGTLNLVDEVNAFHAIKNPVFSSLKAVENEDVYGIMPYAHGGMNTETVFVDAYYVGKIVYPERFADIDPKDKGDEIYTMFVGKPVFDQLNANCNNLGFEKVALK